MSDDEHDCQNEECHGKATLSNELVALVLERLDGRSIQDAVDVIGQVSAILQATVFAKMKEGGVEATVIEAWRTWRNGLVLEAEEDILRQKKGGADGQG
jgi:hypothetical protein